MYLLTYLYTTNTYQTTKHIRTYREELRHLDWRWRIRWKSWRRLMDVGSDNASRRLHCCCHYGRRGTSCSSSGRWCQIHSWWWPGTSTSRHVQLTIFLHVNCRTVRCIQSTGSWRRQCFRCQSIHTITIDKKTTVLFVSLSTITDCNSSIHGHVQLGRTKCPT